MTTFPKISAPLCLSRPLRAPRFSFAHCRSSLRPDLALYVILLVGIASTLSPVRAQMLYSESFDTDPGYVVAKGPDANNISSVVR